MNWMKKEKLPRVAALCRGAADAAGGVSSARDVNPRPSLYRNVTDSLQLSYMFLQEESKNLSKDCWFCG